MSFKKYLKSGLKPCVVRAGNGWKGSAMGKKGIKLYIIYYILYIIGYLFLTLPFALFRRPRKMVFIYVIKII